MGIHGRRGQQGSLLKKRNKNSTMKTFCLLLLLLICSIIDISGKVEKPANGDSGKLASFLSGDFVSGKGEEVANSGSECKTNELAHSLYKKLIQNLKRQGIKARNGTLAIKAFKKKLNALKKKDECLRGADIEARLEMANDIMKYVEMAEKIHTRIKAKLEALIEMEKVAGDYFIQGNITMENIAGVLTPIASITTAVAPIVGQLISKRGGGGGGGGKGGK